MRKNERLEFSEVEKRFKVKELKLLTREYKNNHQLLDCEDNLGYRFNVSILNLEKFSRQKMIYTKNKWSIYNINKYIENNNIKSKLISKEYKSTRSPLKFRCECGNIFDKNLDNFIGRRNYKCPNCSKISVRKHSNKHVIDEFYKYGLTILDISEYKDNFSRMRCKTSDGYIIIKSYSNLNSGFKRNIFSYSHNKDNYVYNVNNYCKINNINLECLEVLDYTCGPSGQYYIKTRCECGSIYKSNIDYIRNNCYRCPVCSKKTSNSEHTIQKFLDNNNIKYIIRPLSFDFYLTEYNTCIEFDGCFHYKKTSLVTEEQFSEQQKRDKIKNDYCKKNNITLIRIPCFEFKRNQLNKIITNKLPPKN